MKKSKPKPPTVAELKREISNLKRKLEVAMQVIKTRPRLPEPEPIKALEPKTWVGGRTDTLVLYGS